MRTGPLSVLKTFWEKTNICTLNERACLNNMPSPAGRFYKKEASSREASVFSKLSKRYASPRRACSLNFFFFLMFIYFARERVQMCAWARAGERQTERGKERIPSKLCTLSAELGGGLDSRNHEIMT